MAPPPLYIILDSQFPLKPFEPLLESFANAGASWLQLREKTASSKAFFETAQTLVSLCRRYGLRVIINDRVDIALLADADGVHLGQDDLLVEEARKILGTDKVVGVSTHNLKQALEAQRSTADYVAIGPVYRTASKQNPDPIVSREELKVIRSQITKPLVAIGGITVENAAGLYDLGIDSLAVIRDILLSDNAGLRIKQYLAMAPSR